MTLYRAIVRCNENFGSNPMNTDRYSTRLTFDGSIYTSFYSIVTRPRESLVPGNNRLDVLIREVARETAEAKRVAPSRGYYLLKHVCTIYSDATTSGDLILDALREACSFAVYTEFDLTLKAFQVDLVVLSLDIASILNGISFKDPSYPVSLYLICI